MSTNNICFNKENQKKYCVSIIKYAPDLSLKCSRIKRLFYYKFFSNFEKLEPTVR